MGCRSKPVRCCARCEDALHLAMLHSILRCSVCRLVWSLCLLRATKCVRPQVNECIADAIFSLAVYDVVVTAWLVRSKPAVVFLLVSATCADMIRHRVLLLSYSHRTTGQSATLSLLYCRCSHL